MGKPCNGVGTDQPYIKESRAYCEGMQYRVDGGPKEDNPHPKWNVPSHESWNRGWDLAQSKAGGTISAEDAGCCALRNAKVEIVLGKRPLPGPFPGPVPLKRPKGK